MEALGLLLVTTLAAGVSPLPAPQVLEVGGCVQAACTGTDEVRICKCIPADSQIKPGITVDRGPKHLEWDTRLVDGKVDDFLVVVADLSGDGKPELVIASRSKDQGPATDTTWDVTIVDGARERFASGESHEFGVDAVAPGSILFTEWETSAKGPVFVGREYSYADGRLEPTKAPVLRRPLSEAFQAERVAAALADHSTTPRKLLAHPSTLKGRDEPPKTLAVAMVLGVTRDDGVVALHLELETGALKMLSVEPDAEYPLRLASLRDRTYYPLRYSAADAETWLAVRSVKVSLEHDHLVGPVWLDLGVPAKQGLFKLLP